jgi:AcrR family transcriptional regulator
MASREEKKAATRKKLLEAAAALVARNGALATSLDAIAEKAGLTKGAVYSNFSSKEELLFELAGVAGVAVDARELFGDERRPVGEVLEDFGALITSEFRSASSRRWRLTYEILNYAQRNARARREIADDWRESREETAAWLERVAGAHGEQLALPAIELALLIEALALGVAQLQRIDPKSVPDDFVSRVLRLLAG